MLRSGHFPGHLRDTFLAAIDAFGAWENGGDEPMVEHEIGFEPHQIPISQACGLVWNCTDIVPGDVFDDIRGYCSYGLRGLEPQQRTYAACARVMLAAIKRAK